MLLSPNELLNELHALGLLSPEQAECASANGEDDGDPSACAARLVKSGVLTVYQTKRILAGKGRRLVVGPYTLLDRLGRGGMSHVYKARHRLMQRVVALKIIGCARRDGDSATSKRFLREVRAVGRLRHPGIVTAYDAGASRGRLYLAMEHVEGVNLEQLVQNSGPLSVSLACEVVRQTVEALRHAHERGLVHGDVKPSNLMLTTPGATVKLLDLGLAQFTDNSMSAEDENPSEEEWCGTADFMAPECRRIDVRRDLYSLGCTFYFLLTGQVPHPGGTWTEKLLRHRLDVPASVRTLRPEVPAEVAAIAERLMARRAEERYPTAAAVAVELFEVHGERGRVSAPSTANTRGANATPLAAANTRGANATPLAAANTRGANTTPLAAVLGALTRLRSPLRVSLGALLAILLGVAAAGGARWIVTPPARPTIPAQRLNEPAFRIEGRPGKFGSLARAIASAADGDVISIHGPGPFVSPPLKWQGKALTIRAGEEIRPRLILEPEDDPWQALLQTDRRLVLEGLNLAMKEPAPRGNRSQAALLICCTSGVLRLTGCRLTSGGDGAAVVVRNAEDVTVQSCRIDAGTIGLSVEVGREAPCRVRVRDSSLAVRAASGAAVSLWASEVPSATSFFLELQGNTIDADRMTAVRALPAALTITAHGNRFAYRSALLSYTGYAERDAWRGTIWQGSDNVYDGPTSWLSVEGEPVSLTDSARAR